MFLHTKKAMPYFSQSEDSEQKKFKHLLQSYKYDGLQLRDNCSKPKNSLHGEDQNKDIHSNPNVFCE